MLRLLLGSEDGAVTGGTRPEWTAEMPHDSPYSYPTAIHVVGRRLQERRLPFFPQSIRLAPETMQRVLWMKLERGGREGCASS